METSMQQEKQLNKLIKQLDDIYKKTDYNGAYGIVSPSKILHTNTMGFSDFEKKLSFEANTKTCIGSLTKQFTATAMLVLEAENKIDLNDSLHRYFPEFVHAKEISLLQLLNMTSGIPDYANLVYDQSLKTALAEGIPESEAHFIAGKTLENDQTTLAEILQQFNSKSLDFTPGSQFAYSNVNYALLGEIITQVTGKPFGEYFREKIFTPLNMLDTSTVTTDSQAVSYRWVDGVRKQYETGILDSADGGMVSTLEDMLKWLQAILNQQILSEEAWERAFTLVHDQYSFGWMKLDDWYYHGGEYLGFYAEIFIHRETKIGKIMLYNLEAPSELDQISMDERSVWRNKLVEYLEN